MHLRLALRLTIALFLVGMPALAAATVINVPQGIGTLQAAIDAANPGDLLRLERPASIATRANVVMMRAPALIDPSRLPATLELPPVRQ